MIICFNQTGISAASLWYRVVVQNIDMHAVYHINPMGSKLCNTFFFNFIIVSHVENNLIPICVPVNTVTVQWDPCSSFISKMCVCCQVFMWMRLEIQWNKVSYFVVIFFVVLCVQCVCCSNNNVIPVYIIKNGNLWWFVFVAQRREKRQLILEL